MKSTTLLVCFTCLLLSAGCNGVQTLSPTQQWGLASASVRAAEQSIGAAHDAGLIDDRDIVTIDPYMRQAYDSLRAMRAAAVKGNYLKTQWFLVQVQGLVAKLAAMEKNAKEMKNVNGSGGNTRNN